MLIEGLPPDSAFARAARGTHWGEQEYLLAHTVNAVRVLTSLTHDMWAKNPGPKPDLIEMPKTQAVLEREAEEATELEQQRAEAAELSAMWSGGSN